MLRAVAKVLNALLKLFVAATPKILAASLRARHAYRFRGQIGSRAVHGQTRKVVRVRAPVARSISRFAQVGKSAFDGQALEAAPCIGCCTSAIGLLLLLLPGSQHHLHVYFCDGIIRIQHNFLGLRRESHEVNLDDVAAARHAFDHESSIDRRRHAHFFSAQRIRGGHAHAGQRRLSAFHRARDIKGDSRRRRRRFPHRGRFLLLCETQAHQQHCADQRHANQHHHSPHETFQSLLLGFRSRCLRISCWF